MLIRPVQRPTLRSAWHGQALPSFIQNFLMLKPPTARLLATLIGCALLSGVARVEAATSSSQPPAAPVETVVTPGSPAQPSAPGSSSWPATGATVSGMEEFDRQFSELLNRWKVPGASIAIMTNGRPVFVRGYGWSDVEKQEKVEPSSLFRIAGVSIPLTAVAVLRLVQDGKLTLEQKALDLFQDLQPCQGSIADKRFELITIQQLLQMSGGWNSKVSGDPGEKPYIFLAARDCKIAPPADVDTTIRYMLGRTLDFGPGTDFAYSNFAYTMLGRIIEKASGQSYEEYVRKQILAPAGITRMQCARTRVSARAPGEVCYYPFPGQPPVASPFPGDKGLVPAPYGCFNLEAHAASGGWIATAVDLLRFAACLAGEGMSPSPLSAETMATMTARPAIPRWKDTDAYFAMGWEVRPQADGRSATRSKDGGMPGSMAFLIRRYDGIAWAVVFNSRPEEKDEFMREVKDTVWRAINDQHQWPPYYGFKDYP